MRPLVKNMKAEKIIVKALHKNLSEFTEDQAMIEKPTEVEELKIDKQVNLMDQFIIDGGFDKAFNDVFGLPESVVESLKEVS